MKKTFYLLILLTSCVIFSQQKYPKNDFRNPLDIPIKLAGTFGELRTNHLHSGIDIKTNGVSGKKVYTAKEGYVSRIKISLWGYGKAIYITHPNGYTTVYAHLDKFSDRIEKYIKAKQYQKKSFGIQVFPNKSELIIQKNEVIAFSGNSGGSSAPHLHFEIRDSKTEKIINPLLFGLKVPDNISPILLGLRAIPLGKNAAVNKLPVAQEIQFKKIKNNLYQTEKIKAIGKIGLEINTHDLLNHANNKNGVFSISMFVNDILTYHHDLETFAFDKSKHINLLINYEFHAKRRQKFQKTYVEPQNKLSIYKKLHNQGFLYIENNKDYRVKILIKDVANNTTTIKIPIKGNNVITPIIKENSTTDFFINKEKYTVFKKENTELRFPRNAFYKDLYIDYKAEKNKIKVHKPTVPMNKNYTLTYFTNNLNDQEKKYVYFAYKKGKYFNYVSTYKKENKIYTNTKYLGDFYLKYDSISPKIYKPSFYPKQNISRHKTLSIHIKDKETGIKNYYATIDDQWILMEYDPKKNKLVFDLNDLKATKKQHSFKLTVQDVLENTQTFETSFYK